MLIAQLTDPHVRPPGKRAYGIADTNALLARAVDAVLAFTPRPDLVLVTGDLADVGAREEYGTLRDQLDRLTMPVYVIPGNHDRRDKLRAAFAEQPWIHQHEHFIQYAIEGWPVRLLALDTVVPGHAHGELCAERLAWLEARLAEVPDRPTLIMMHHPPFVTGIEHMDAINCVNGEELGSIVRRHPSIERIVCGHHHRPIQIRWQGTLVSVAPGIAHQVTLDLRPGAPASFTMEPPAFHLHRWIPGTGLVTHQAYIGTYAGPYPFIPEPDYPGQQP
jgi:3',5'-cyclic-AMP phosphodiesterase